MGIHDNKVVEELSNADKIKVRIMAEAYKEKSKGEHCFIRTTDYQANRIYFEQLVAEGMLKPIDDRRLAILTDLGILTSAGMSGYFGYLLVKKNRQKIEDENLLYLNKMLKYQYGTRYLAVAAFVISVLAIVITILNFAADHQIGGTQ
jgi:hypothetical protein